MLKLARFALPVVAALVLAVLVTGPERIWAQFGPADLGDVDFATLERRTTPNDALACLPAFCAAKADVAAPIFMKPLGDVFLAVQDALAQEPDLEQVAADAGQGTSRYVQRSRLMRFPDTINVKVAPADGGVAVLIYSRSQLGKGDMGVNRQRVERWVGLIRAQLGG